MNYIEEMKLQIEKQIEKEHELSPVKCCAAQLTDIVGTDHTLAQLVCEDFANGRTVKECEKQIKAFVDKNHKGNSGFCPPWKAEEIIREFFGLGTAAEKPQTAAPTPMSPPKPKVMSLKDLL